MLIVSRLRNLKTDLRIVSRNRIFYSSPTASLSDQLLWAADSAGRTHLTWLGLAPHTWLIEEVQVGYLINWWWPVVLVNEVSAVFVE